MSRLQIVRWSDSYARAFKDLSVEWLEKYVSVEPADLEILDHPHEAVLNPGGMIFFALDNGRPVGTVAMIPCADGNLELAKLAVTESHKGRGISNQLMQAALDYAEEKGAHQVILYTNSRLIPAIHLYQKYGFHEVPLEHNKYLESDRMMVRPMH